MNLVAMPLCLHCEFPDFISLLHLSTVLSYDGALTGNLGGLVDAAAELSGARSFPGAATPPKPTSNRVQRRQPDRGRSTRTIRRRRPRTEEEVRG